MPQMGAFSREIATWICHQSSPFHLSSLSEFVVNTERELSSSILAHVDSATKQYVLDMNKKNPFWRGFMTIRIGTRSSNLALWQANAVQKKLEKYGISSDLVTLSSTGDRSLGGQLSGSVGQFIHAIDDSLLSGEVDIAVHSSKDVPVEVDRRIENLAYLERGCTSDLIIVRKSESIDSLDKVLNGSSYTPLATILDHFPHGAMFGTVSGRRQSFLLSQRPDIIPLAVRGHVENRLTRLLDGRVDAVVLAEVGISRLNSVGVLDDVKELSAFRIDPSDWPTAPGQGAISVHCKKDRFQEFKSLRLVLNHEQTEQDVTTERRLLKEVGGGCLFQLESPLKGNELTSKYLLRTGEPSFAKVQSTICFNMQEISMV